MLTPISEETVHFMRGVYLASPPHLASLADLTPEPGWLIHGLSCFLGHGAMATKSAARFNGKEKKPL